MNHCCVIVSVGEKKEKPGGQREKRHQKWRETEGRRKEEELNK